MPTSKRRGRKAKKAHDLKRKWPGHDSETAPDWSGKCEVCGESPIVPVTGMCGPCTFGEANTAGGNW